MIEIPLGKALVSVEKENPKNPPESKWVGDPDHKSKCDDCFFDAYYSPFINSACRIFECRAESREDGKSVIFKLVDYPAKEEK